MKKKLKYWIRNVASFVFRIFPITDLILFESAPVYADNTRAVFDEMVRRGLHKKYRFIWLQYGDFPIPPDLKNAECIYSGKKYSPSWIRAKFLMCRARALISCNNALPSLRPGQYAIFLNHGAPLKNVSKYYSVSPDFDKYMCLSEYLSPLDAAFFGCDISKMLANGFPRNDILFSSKADIHAMFPGAEFDKLIYWMPTFRQHKNQKVNASTIAMPIIYDEEIAKKINDCAKESRILIVVKPHFAQDVSRIKVMRLSNLVFINDDYLRRCGVTNYELLGKADALLTDYSSVYYDYLLTDRPIGLCWDDYAEFEAREGFLVDMDKVMAAGEKIYTADDLCGFISRLSRNKDVLSEERKKVAQMIHNHMDGKATTRIVDYIMDSIEK